MVKLKHIPSLRFPEFKGDWEKMKLGEVMNFKVTNSFSRENLNYGYGNVKNIHYGDIHTKFQTLFDITKESVPFINEDISIERISNDFYCKEGDIVFADASEDISDVGKSIEIKNLNGERLLSGLHTLLARPIENKFMIGFNGYLFKSNNVRVQIQKESQGSKVLSINVGRISGINLAFPNIQEQTKITSFLTAVDDKLQVLKQKKTLLEQHKKGLMQKIFSQELRFKDDNGNGYPDWVEKKLGDVCDVRDGTHDSPKYVENGYPFITSKNLMKDGNIDFRNVSFISEVDYNRVNQRSKVNINDILFGMIGTIGNPVIVKSEGFAIKNVALIKEKKEIKNLFLIHFFKGDAINQQFFEQNTGGTQKFLSLSIVRNLVIQIPSIDEQIKIANFLSTIDDKINHCKGQIEKTEVWKKGLLQQMFV